MESGPYQWCQKGSIEPMPKEQMVSAHFLRIRMTTSQQHISLDMETQKLHYNYPTEMCTEADLVSGSWWAQYNMFIAQTLFFPFLSTANGFHSLWFKYLPSSLFILSSLSTSPVQSPPDSVLQFFPSSLSFHLDKSILDKSICQINTVLPLPFIFRVMLVLVPFLFLQSLICFSKLLFFSWRIPTSSTEKVKYSMIFLISLPFPLTTFPSLPSHISLLFFSPHPCHVPDSLLLFFFFFFIMAYSLSYCFSPSYCKVCCLSCIKTTLAFLMLPQLLLHLHSSFHL